MAIPYRAKKLGHKVHLAGRNRKQGWVTYQCGVCLRLATREKGKEFGPLLKGKCPGSPYAHR